MVGVRVFDTEPGSGDDRPSTASSDAGDAVGEALRGTAMADHEPDSTDGGEGAVPSDGWVVVQCGECGSKQRARADLSTPRCTSCWLPIDTFQKGVSSASEPTTPDPLAEALVPLGVGAAILALIALIVVSGRAWAGALLFAAIAIMGGLIVLRQPVNVVCLQPRENDPMNFCTSALFGCGGRSETACPSVALHAADDMMTAINQGAGITIVKGGVSVLVMLGLLGYRLLARDPPDRDRQAQRSD